MGAPAGAAPARGEALTEAPTLAAPWLVRRPVGVMNGWTTGLVRKAVRPAASSLWAICEKLIVTWFPATAGVPVTTRGAAGDRFASPKTARSAATGAAR